MYLALRWVFRDDRLRARGFEPEHEVQHEQLTQSAHDSDIRSIKQKDGLRQTD